MSEPDGQRHAYHSKFGGLWIDLPDFPVELSRRVRDGKIPAHLEAPIRDFEKRGVVVLENAAPEDALDGYEAFFSKAFREGHDRLIAQVMGDPTPRPVTAEMNLRNIRLVDSFAVIPAALDLLASPRLVEFMQTLFEDRPVLFQSLSFEMGSEQGLHQDTAYVVVDPPLEMLACWIALEDVKPGCGELTYLVGSHRLPDFDFGGKKHWDVNIDGLDKHTEWEQWIITEGRKRGFAREEFMAKRGDILVWHADLAHGGRPIADPRLTRRSLVGHYCPARRKPVYPIDIGRMEHGGILYCSCRYELLSEQFDEEGYLAANPDVAEAVRAGWFRSGREHFDRYGRQEGRLPTRSTTDASRVEG